VKECAGYKPAGLGASKKKTEGFIKTEDFTRTNTGADSFCPDLQLTSSQPHRLLAPIRLPQLASPQSVEATILDFVHGRLFTIQRSVYDITACSFALA
jgi:hypothetical protein